jgi:hypothetical protein
VWYARNGADPSISQFGPSVDHGNGCIDPVYASMWTLFLPLHDPRRDWYNLNEFQNGRSVMISDLGNPSDLDMWCEFQRDFPDSLQGNISSLCKHQQSNSTNSHILLNTNRGNVCQQLPSGAMTSASFPKVSLEFDYDINRYANAHRFLYSTLSSAIVIAFVKMLSAAASCRCARKGSRRKITVCCCKVFPSQLEIFP